MLNREEYVKWMSELAGKIWDEANPPYEGCPVKVVYLDNFKGEDKLHYKHEGDSGFDLSAGIDEVILLEPNERRVIQSGIRLACPIGTEIQVRPRSGTALRKGITVANTPGTVDACYRGEVGIIVHNISGEVVAIEPGERIAQAVLCPVIKAVFKEVTDLDDTTRGEGAYNSTGAR